MPIVQISGLLLYLYGCSNLPTERQSLEFISTDQTGRLVVMRLTQSDTGWLKGTGHFKATIWNPGDTTLEFWDHAPKSHVDWNEQQISIGSRHMVQINETNWQLDSHFDEWNLRLLGICDAQPAQWMVTPDWSTQVLCPNMTNTGWTQSHEQSQLLNGSSIAVLHKGNELKTDSQWFISTNSTLHLMIEMTPNGVFGYMNTIDEDGQWHTHSILNVTQSDAIWQIKTSSGTVQIDDIQDIGVEDPFEHIASWERTLAQQYYPLNTITWRKGHGVWQDKPFVVIIREQRISQ